ncbi:DUF1523 family protein [Rhodobacteraceae bacterium XHP0102]|nr:DUF1523 family protein [Rhodobacteraceae bacterium XHP0102]
MRWPRITALLVLGALIVAFFHYTLPKRDILRITQTEVIRQDFSGFNRLFYARGDTGNAQLDSRDLRLVNTVDAQGQVHVFRNEDTGFGWPPYFKLDSSDVQAEAANLVSTQRDPIWVAVTHYGWRSRILTTYPNIVGLRQVDGPEVTLIPWMPVAILVFIGLLAFVLWRLWERFETRVIDPIYDRAAVLWSKSRNRFRGK